MPRLAPQVFIPTATPQPTLRIHELYRLSPCKAAQLCCWTGEQTLSAEALPSGGLSDQLKVVYRGSELFQTTGAHGLHAMLISKADASTAWCYIASTASCLAVHNTTGTDSLSLARG